MPSQDHSQCHKHIDIHGDSIGHNKPLKGNSCVALNTQTYLTLTNVTHDCNHLVFIICISEHKINHSNKVNFVELTSQHRNHWTTLLVHILTQ